MFTTIITRRKLSALTDTTTIYHRLTPVRSTPVITPLTPDERAALDRVSGPERQEWRGFAIERVIR